MRQLFLLLVAGVGVSPVMAQQRDSVLKHTGYRKDARLSRWVLDVNLMGGKLSNKYNMASTAGNYPLGHNVTTGNLKFANGGSWGADVQLGYFFGKGKHFGVGTGLSYFVQSGDVTLDTFHAEYQSTDVKNRPVRQVVTATGPIREQLNMTNINIPLMFKYKDRFSKHWGVTADAGLLINVQLKNEYTANAAFDYEAIYKYSEGRWVYENSSEPAGNDFLVTKAHFLKNSPNGDVNKYFVAQAAQGNNVGLNVAPASESGNVSYKGAIGFLVSPAINFFLSDNVALSLGVWYMYQHTSPGLSDNYRLTYNIGEYNSVLKSAESVSSQSYGAKLGARFFVFGERDKDGDGVADKKDACPDVFGLADFQGCPDTDRDGIQDKDDRCPTVFGLSSLHGCPDTDGDGIADMDDRCPEMAGPISLKGCPDKDGDNIADVDDHCPETAGIAAFQGCPDTDGDGIQDNMDKCPEIAGPADNQGCPVDTAKPAPPAPVEKEISSTITFKLNRTTVGKSSYPVLQAAATKAKADRSAIIIVDGYTDSKGRAAYNRKLSVKRAKAVKAVLVKMGADGKQIEIHGHGSKEPVGNNKTRKGRIENRRVEIHLNASNK